MRIDERACAAHDFDLARFRHAGETAGQLANDLVLPRAKLFDFDLRRPEPDTVLGQELHFIHHAGDVQQRFRWNAADVEAYAAQSRIAFDEHGFHAEVGAPEGGAVAARTRAQ